MASSGSFNTGAYEVRYLTFAWSVASQSVQNNQTVINYSLKGAGSNGSYWYYVQNVTLIIDGRSIVCRSPHRSSSRQGLYSHQVS